MRPENLDGEKGDAVNGTRLLRVGRGSRKPMPPAPPNHRMIQIIQSSILICVHGTTNAPEMVEEGFKVGMDGIRRR